jgi:hypothetical protein
MTDQQTQQVEAPVTVSLGDIATVLQIIDVVSRRGAIQGNEMAGVGTLRNKLELFLNQNDVKTQQDGQRDANVETTEVPEGPLTGKLV